eukprot:11175349-Lingulodinium_polyedra.AAC.1
MLFLRVLRHSLASHDLKGCKDGEGRGRKEWECSQEVPTGAVVSMHAQCNACWGLAFVRRQL